MLFRGVAQFGSVLGSGPRGRGFKSRHSDHNGAKFALLRFSAYKNGAKRTLLQRGNTEPLRYSRRRRTRKKVVAKVSRCERVYKRTGEPSVPFCERGGTTARVTDFSVKKNRNGAKSVPTWRRERDSNPYISR